MAAVEDADGEGGKRKRGKESDHHRRTRYGCATDAVARGGGTDLPDADVFVGPLPCETVVGAGQQMVNQAWPDSAMVNEWLRRRRQVADETGLVTGEDGRRRCAWGGRHARIHGLSRPRMGAAGHRRCPPVREDLPRGLPVRPVLADHPQEARELPQRPSPASTITRSPASATRTSRACLAMPASCAIAARSNRPSTMPPAPIELEREAGSLAAYFWTLRAGADVAGEADGPGGARDPVDRRRNRSPCRRTSRSAAGASSGRPPAMPSCRRWAWSTTTGLAAGATGRWRRSARPSPGPARDGPEAKGGSAPPFRWKLCLSAQRAPARGRAAGMPSRVRPISAS